MTGDGALVLRGVRISQRPGNYPPATAPAAGVAALPHTVYFDARPDETWEVRSSGKADVGTLAIQRPDGLTLTRRDPVPDWQRIALVGSTRAVDLDYRVDTTPYELTLKFAPKQGLGTRIFLHTNLPISTTRQNRFSPCANSPKGRRLAGWKCGFIPAIFTMIIGGVFCLPRNGAMGGTAPCACGSASIGSPWRWAMTG